MLLLFNTLLLLMWYIDYKNYRNMITPYSAIAIVYLSLIDLNNILLTKMMDFYTVTDETLTVLLLFFFMFFCIDFFFGRIYRISKKRTSILIEKKRIDPLVNVVFYLGLASYIASFFLNYRLFGWNMKGNNNGILGHLSSLAQVIAPLYWQLNRNRHKVIIPTLLVLVLFLISMLFGGKYVFMIYLLNFICFFLLRRKVKTGKLIRVALFIVCIAVALFLFIYGLMPLLTGSYGSSANWASTSSFAIEHMFGYLIGPIVGNNYATTHWLPNGIETVFTVPINIVRMFTGEEYVNPIHTYVFWYSRTGVVNVSGLIGEAIYCLGKAGAAVYLGALMVFINLFYCRARTKRKYLLTTGLLIAVLVVSFFCNFFTVSGVVIPLMFLIILETILQKVKF